MSKRSKKKNKRNKNQNQNHNTLDLFTILRSRIQPENSKQEDQIKSNIQEVVPQAIINSGMQFTEDPIPEEKKEFVITEDLYEKHHMIPYDIPREKRPGKPCPYNKEVIDCVLRLVYTAKTPLTGKEMSNKALSELRLKGYNFDDKVFYKYFIGKNHELPLDRVSAKPGYNSLKESEAKNITTTKIKAKVESVEIIKPKKVDKGLIYLMDSNSEECKKINLILYQFCMYNYATSKYSVQMDIYKKYVDYYNRFCRNKYPKLLCDEDSLLHYLERSGYYDIQRVEGNLLVKRLDKSKTLDKWQHARINKPIAQYIHDEANTYWSIKDYCTNIISDLPKKDTADLIKIQTWQNNIKDFIMRYAIPCHVSSVTKQLKETPIENQIDMNEITNVIDTISNTETPNEKVRKEYNPDKQETQLSIPSMTSAKRFVTTKLNDIDKISYDDVLKQYKIFCEKISEPQFIHDLHTEMVRTGHYNTIVENDVAYYKIPDIKTDTDIKNQMYQDLLVFIKTMSTPTLTAEEILDICQQQYSYYNITIEDIKIILDKNNIGYTQKLRTTINSNITPNTTETNNITNATTESNNDCIKYKNALLDYTDIPIYMCKAKLDAEQELKDIVLPIKHNVMKGLHEIYDDFNINVTNYPNFEAILESLNIIKYYKENWRDIKRKLLGQINICEVIHQQFRHDSENTFPDDTHAIAEGYVGNVKRAAIYMDRDLLIFAYLLENIDSTILGNVIDTLISNHQNRDDVTYNKALDFKYSDSESDMVKDIDELKLKRVQQYVANVTVNTNYDKSIKLIDKSLYIKHNRLDNNEVVRDVQRLSGSGKTPISMDNFMAVYDKNTTQTVTEQKVIDNKKTYLYKVMYERSDSTGAFKTAESYYRANSEQQAMEQFNKYRRHCTGVLFTNVRVHKLNK